MTNGKNIKALVEKINTVNRSLDVERSELGKRLEASAKTIGGIDCALAYNGTVLVNIGQPGGSLIPAETFKLIVGWFNKHYGDIDEPGAE